MKRNLFATLFTLCSCFLNAATDMPEQENWTQRMASLLKEDCEFYDAVTLERLQTELKKVPEKSQGWVETILQTEVKLLNGSPYGGSDDLWKKSYIVGLLGSVDEDSRPWLTRMLGYPDATTLNAPFRAKFIQSLVSVPAAKQPWIEKIFCSFVDPLIVSSHEIIQELSRTAPEDQEWVEQVLRHYFSHEKLASDEIVAALNSIKSNRSWIENKAQTLISFDREKSDEENTGFYVGEIFFSLKKASNHPEIFNRRLEKYLPESCSLPDKTTVIKLASMFLEISDDLYDQVVTCLLPPDCSQKTMIRTWHIILECAHSEIDYEKLVALSKNLKPYNDDSRESRKKFKSMILSCWRSYVEPVPYDPKNNPMFS